MDLPIVDFFFLILYSDKKQFASDFKLEDPSNLKK